MKYPIQSVALAMHLANVLTTATLQDAERRVEANRVVEFMFTSEKVYSDPFNEVKLDVLFRAPDGQQLRVPAFWAGGSTWKVRYASGQLGVHRFRTECTDVSNTKLHGVERAVKVIPYMGNNPLYKHGPIRVSNNRRHFEHVDGTPFFWLGDTWWMGLCKRLRWPDEFKTLAADRKEKGFNVIQIVAGLYPDMPPFDQRGANEAGFPWEKDYSCILPEYFDATDKRLQYLADSGFVPCIVGAWGYHLPWMGTERMKQHWRYLVARYAALPVVWCAAGEGTMPYYLSKKENKEKERVLQKREWTEVIGYIRQIDPFRRMVTIHPSTSAREAVTDSSVLDFDMLQTSHGLRDQVSRTVSLVRRSYAAEPTMPTLNGEACYEDLVCGWLGDKRITTDVSRLMFWASIINSGIAGYTYGANGIWQVNRKEEPFGKSPHGGNWGTTPWDEAMKLPGSRQVGLGAKLLRRYPWHRFEPHPEQAAWAEPDRKQDEFDAPYATGIPRQILIIYLPTADPTVVSKLEPDVEYMASYFNPITGNRTELGIVLPDTDGSWMPPDPPKQGQDWVLILEAN